MGNMLVWTTGRTTCHEKRFSGRKGREGSDGLFCFSLCRSSIFPFRLSTFIPHPSYFYPSNIHQSPFTHAVDPSLHCHPHHCHPQQLNRHRCKRQQQQPTTSREVCTWPVAICCLTSSVITLTHDGHTNRHTLHQPTPPKLLVRKVKRAMWKYCIISNTQLFWLLMCMLILYSCAVDTPI
jgi:hypothetical protein